VRLPAIKAVYAFNEKYRLECQTGLAPVGPLQDLVCLGENKWSYGRITCQPKLCPPLQVLNAHVLEGDSNALNNTCRPSVGGQCTVTCDTARGYTPVEASFEFACTESGLWKTTTTNRAPSDIVCGCPVLPRAQIDPFVEADCPVSIIDGDECSFSNDQCRAGFRADGGKFTCDITVCGQHTLIIWLGFLFGLI